MLQPIHSENRSSQKNQRGSAMVTALALVVLMTVVVVALFLQARMNQMSVAGSNQRIIADEVALGASDYVVNQLLVYISNSMNVSSGGTTIASNYWLTNAAKAKLPSVTGLTNLVMQSSATAPNNESNASTLSSSDTNATNGRFVSISRWNYPALITNGAMTNAPSWIYLSSSTGANSTNTNSSNIGRFAYNVYDVSGLLDMNAAGSSVSGIVNSTTAAVTNARGLLGTLAGADVTAITNSLSVSALAQARNDTNSIPNYTNFVRLLSATGYLTAFINNSLTNASYSPFNSRQDLMRYLAQPSVLGTSSTNVLPYLTHFSRHVTAPSWGPTKPTGSTLNYAGASTDVNPFIPSVVVSSPFTRLTGEQATNGEPLVKYKFPLSRLAWVIGNANNASADFSATILNIMRTNNGASTDDAATLVQQAFGLTATNLPSSGQGWVYTATNTATGGINTLSQVAGLNREPNFFELLKAGILSGSLGQSVTYQAPTIVSNNVAAFHDTNTDLQIIQIGANAIDQVNTSGTPVPTQIILGTNQVAGVVPLPELYGIAFLTSRQNTTNVYGYMLPILWNPHSAGNASDYNFQVKLSTNTTSGNAGTVKLGYYTNQGTPYVPVVDSGNLPNGTSMNAAANTPSPIPPGALLAQRPGNSMLSSPGFLTTNLPPAGGAGNNAFYCGVVLNTPSGTNTTQPEGMIYQLSGVKFDLYVGTDTSTTNAPYYVGSLPQMDTVIVQQDPAPPTTNGGFSSPACNVFVVRVDPRTSRFGLQCYTNSYFTTGGGLSLFIPTPHDKTTASNAITFNAPSFSDANWQGGIAQFSEIVNNSNGSSLYYKDPDGIVRPAQGAYMDFDTSKTTYNPSGAIIPYRPTVLNQPFYSVGQLGYVFRDVPWKSLDMYSSNSADSGLLDLFSVYDEPALVGGRINLNTYSNVITALLNNNTHYQMPGVGSTTASTVSGLFAAATNLRTPADIVNIWSLLLPVNSLDNVKQTREIIAHGLASEDDQRTWNFLIDVIAQTGHMNALGKAFITTGERRVWVHVAIDRVTGKVVAKEVEPVQE